MLAGSFHNSHSDNCSSHSHKSRTTQPNSHHRVPLSLQKVILASNRGETDVEAPSDRSAQRTFWRRGRRRGLWLAWSRSRSESGTGDTSLPSLSMSCTSLQQSQDKNNTSKNNKAHCHRERSQTPEPWTPSKNQQQHQKNTALSPQLYLDGLLASRGYSTQMYSTMTCAYYNRPTSYQQASHGVQLVEAVRKSDAEQLHALLDCGLSHNPCNHHGESLMHLICRRGDAELLRIMIHVHGAIVQVCDDYGRTPLHDACWVAEASRPNFECIQHLLEADVHLLHMTDSRGCGPLSYVKSEHWCAWLEFLEAHKDVYWPKNSQSTSQGPPPLTLLPPDSCPIPDPVDRLDDTLACLVAEGRLEPEEAVYLQQMAASNDAVGGLDDTTTGLDDTTTGGDVFNGNLFDDHNNVYNENSLDEERGADNEIDSKQVGSAKAANSEKARSSSGDDTTAELSTSIHDDDDGENGDEQLSRDDFDYQSKTTIGSDERADSCDDQDESYSCINNETYAYRGRCVLQHNSAISDDDSDVLNDDDIHDSFDSMEEEMDTMLRDMVESEIHHTPIPWSYHPYNKNNMNQRNLTKLQQQQ